MIVRALFVAMAACALSACAGVIDRCGDGLPEGPPGRALTR